MTSFLSCPKALEGTAGQRRSILAERRAGMAVFIALLFPVLVAMGLLAVDAVRAYSQASLVGFATQMAALAGGNSIGDYYSQGHVNGATSIRTTSATIGDATTASSANLSNVIQSTTLGTWDSTAFTFTPLATGSSASPNAVQVVGQTTLSTYFGGAFGVPTITITKSATAAIGTTPFNVVVLNDMGGPNQSQGLGATMSNQAYWWAQQLKADIAVLGCVQASGNTPSMFGLTGFVDQSYVL